MRTTIDFEFDGYKGASLSLGLACEDGRCLYLIFQDTDTPKVCTPWVTENVLPILHDSPYPAEHVTYDLARKRLTDFFRGDPNPTVIADWPDDIARFCELLLTGPGAMIDIPGIKFEVRRIDSYPSRVFGAIQHNAMWDAIALRDWVIYDELQRDYPETQPA